MTDRRIPLDRLQNYFGISGPSVDWFESYVSAKCIISMFRLTKLCFSLECLSLVLRPIPFVLYIQPLFSDTSAFLGRSVQEK